MTPLLDPGLFDLGSVLWASHCAEGPVPRQAAEAVRAFLAKELRPWELGVDEWLALPARVRAEAGRLFGASPDDLSVTGSTSSGLSAIAQGFAWQPGDEVLAPLGEFPSNVWPWKALEPRGVRLREVPLWEGQLAGRRAWESPPPRAGLEPERRLLEAIGPATRILTVSWVRFQDGLQLDLPRLAEGCARRAVHLVVDGIQGAGVLPVSLEGVAAFATGVQKGLLAPQGLGLLWTAPRFRAGLNPPGSWLSVEGGADFRRPSTDFDRRWLGDGRRFELGGPNGLSLVALESSLRLLNEAGGEAFAAHVRSLSEALLAGLEAIPAWSEEAARLTPLLAAGRLGPILALHHGGRGAEWLEALSRAGMRRGIYTSVREGYLRLALHGWHGGEDLARLLDWLRDETR